MLPIERNTRCPVGIIRFRFARQDRCAGQFLRPPSLIVPQRDADLGMFALNILLGFPSCSRCTLQLGEEIFIIKIVVVGRNEQCPSLIISAACDLFFLQSAERREQFRGRIFLPGGRCLFRCRGTAPAAGFGETRIRFLRCRKTAHPARRFGLLITVFG